MFETTAPDIGIPVIEAHGLQPRTQSAAAHGVNNKWPDRRLREAAEGAAITVDAHAKPEFRRNQDQAVDRFGRRSLRQMIEEHAGTAGMPPEVDPPAGKLLAHRPNQGVDIIPDCLTRRCMATPSARRAMAANIRQTDRDAGIAGQRRGRPFIPGTTMRATAVIEDEKVVERPLWQMQFKSKRQAWRPAGDRPLRNGCHRSLRQTGGEAGKIDCPRHGMSPSGNAACFVRRILSGRKTTLQA